MPLAYHISMTPSSFVVKPARLSSRFPAAGGGLRGAITEFSPAARRRMVLMANKIDWQSAGRLSFLTLTYERDVQASEIKRAWTSLYKRLSRISPNIFAMWRIEKTRRGRWHMHCILGNAPYLDQRALQEAWRAITKQRVGIVHIRRVNDAGMAVRYVSKYMSKVAAAGASLDNGAYLTASNQDSGDAASQASTGRHWGLVGRSNVPWHDERRLLVLADAHISSVVAQWAARFNPWADAAGESGFWAVGGFAREAQAAFEPWLSRPHLHDASVAMWRLYARARIASMGPVSAQSEDVACDPVTGNVYVATSWAVQRLPGAANPVAPLEVAAAEREDGGAAVREYWQQRRAAAVALPHRAVGWSYRVLRREF